MESFLGTLALAHAINRTLVLPPFIFNFTGFTSLPFGTFFDVATLQVVIGLRPHGPLRA